MEEIWKDIPGYEGKYQASNMGRIRSLDRKVRGVCHYTGKDFYRRIKGQLLKPGRFCKAGHVSVVLGHGTTGKPVHQLVMKTFAGETPEGMEVLHINGDPADNRLENLRYGTRRDNILDVYRIGKAWRKLTADDVVCIRFKCFCGFCDQEIADEYDVTKGTVAEIRKGRTYKWLE